MQAYALFGILALAFVLSGCCASTPPSSSGSCPYGTYGSACSSACSAAGGDNCFSSCMDGVRNEGLGDATTCCKESFRTNCESRCNALGSTYGSDAQSECLSGCLGIITSTGFSPDICYLPNA